MAAAEVAQFRPDEELLKNLQHLMDLEARDATMASTAGLGLRFTARTREDVQYRAAGGYPGLQARMVELAGWVWLPIYAEEAQKGVRLRVKEGCWNLIHEISGAHSERRPKGARYVHQHRRGLGGSWNLRIPSRSHYGPVFE